MSKAEWTINSKARPEAAGEHVVAWMPMPEAFRGELTDGYEYVWEEAE